MSDEPFDLYAARDRARDLREKFVDGRGYAFKRDFPDWFNAFQELLGYLDVAIDELEMRREQVHKLENSPWYRDYTEIGRRVLELHDKLVAHEKEKELVG